MKNIRIDLDKQVQTLRKRVSWINQIDDKNLYEMLKRIHSVR